MNVLVTGGAGFIGSHLVEELLHAGHRVRVLDNLSSGKRDNLAQAGEVEFIEGDIRDRAAVAAAVRGTEAIVHLAAVASVQASIDDPIGTHETNLVGTLNLLEAVRANGCTRFVYASSAAVYGDTQHLPVAEHDGVAPLSPYAADKLAGEHYLEFYRRKFGLKGTAYRFFNIYGPRQDPSSPYSGVISIFARRIGEGAPVTIFGDGQQTRDFVYVGDLTQLLVQTLTNDAAVGQVINVGRGIECSLLDLLTEMERIAERKIERRHEPARVGDILRSCADIARLRASGGRVPATPLAQGLERLLHDR
jgi:UDP-glucose 4-epimerase